MATNPPGAQLFLEGRPVTVLAESANRTFYIPGHHDYHVCFTELLKEFDIEQRLRGGSPQP